MAQGARWLASACHIIRVSGRELLSW
jgi:hypothetical protein